MFACVIVLAVGAATVTEGAEAYPPPSDETAILVTLSTPANDSPDVIPKTLSSITAVVVPADVVVFPLPLIGGLVTVHAEALFVDGVNVLVAVNAFVDVPEKVCAAPPVPVNEITEPPAVADNVTLFAFVTVFTKKIVSSVRPPIAVPPFA